MLFALLQYMETLYMYITYDMYMHMHRNVVPNK